MMSLQTIAAWFVTAAVAYLLASYALGGPVALVRALVAIASRRRARYRGHPDDVMASSRFTIPVSVILPIGAEQDVTGAVDHLLGSDLPGARSDRGHFCAARRARVDAGALRLEGVRDFLPALAADAARARPVSQRCRRAPAGRRVRRPHARRRVEQRRQPGAVPVRVLRRSSRALRAGFAPQEHAARGRRPGRRHRGHDHDCRAARSGRDEGDPGSVSAILAAPLGAARAARPRRAQAPAARAGRAARLHVMAAGRRPRDRRVRARPPRGTGRPDAARAPAACSGRRSRIASCTSASPWGPRERGQHSMRCSPSMSDARTP